jgi:hypothetical protein
MSDGNESDVSQISLPPFRFPQPPPPKPPSFIGRDKGLEKASKVPVDGAESDTSQFSLPPLFDSAKSSDEFEDPSATESKRKLPLPAKLRKPLKSNKSKVQHLRFKTTPKKIGTIVEETETSGTENSIPSSPATTPEPPPFKKAIYLKGAKDSHIPLCVLQTENGLWVQMMDRTTDTTSWIEVQVDGTAAALIFKPKTTRLSPPMGRSNS